MKTEPKQLSGLHRLFLNLACLPIRDRMKRDNLRVGAKKFGGIIPYLNARKQVKRASANDNSKTFPQYLSALLIIKDEAPYTKEWLEFHIRAGIEKFYIYDNGSTDNIAEVLAPYIKSGIVEYIPFPGPQMQLPAYNHFVENYGNNTKWVAVFDVDEFITPISGGKIPDYLHKLPDDAAQYTMRWRNFGSDGHDRTPAGSVVENYLHRFSDEAAQKQVKSIVNPRKIVNIGIHFSDVVGKSYDPANNVIKNFYKHIETMPCDIVSCYHYWCKSRESFEKRWTKGDVAYANHRNKIDWTAFNKRDGNDVFDDTALRYFKGEI